MNERNVEREREIVICCVVFYSKYLFLLCFFDLNKEKGEWFGGRENREREEMEKARGGGEVTGLVTVSETSSGSSFRELDHVFLQVIQFI